MLTNWYLGLRYRLVGDMPKEHFNLYVGFILRAGLYHNILVCRWCVVFGGGLIACYGSHLVHYDGAGSLAAIILAFVAMVQWRRWRNYLIYPEPLTLKIVQLRRTLKGGLDGPQSSEQRVWQNVDHPRADSFCSHWLWSSGDSKAVWIKTSQELRMLSRSLSDCQSTI